LAGKKKGGGDFRDALRTIKKSLPDETLSSAVPPADAPRTCGGEPEGSFVEEMARLAVKRLEDSADRQEDEDLQAEGMLGNSVPLAENGEKEEARDEEALFLAALGNLDRVFHDGIDVEEQGEAQPRQLKSLGKKRVDPDDALDLHGLTRAEALQRVRFFLEKASYNGLRTVLIVTGKGKGSEGGGVLRSAVADFLDNEGAKWVSAWGAAPRSLGGDGAVAVFLRSNTSRR